MPAYNSSFTGQEIDDILTNFLNRAYPIGSVYMSMINTNPSALFGGTWVQIKDKFIVSAGDTYTGGDTGGTDTHTHGFTAVGTVENHTLTIEEMPAHKHNYRHYVSTECGYVPANSRANSISVRTDTNGINNTGGTFTDRTGSVEYNGDLLYNTGGGGGPTTTVLLVRHPQLNLVLIYLPILLFIYGSVLLKGMI